MYGKLYNGNMSIAPSTIEFEDGSCICNPTEENLLDLGYKPINESAKPTLEANQYYIESYSENENEIIVSYEVKTTENLGGMP